MEEDFPEENTKLKKVLIIVVASLMLSMVLVYFLPGDVLQVLEGRLESSQMEGYEVEYAGGKVVFSAGVYELLREIYLYLEYVLGTKS